MIFVFGLQLDDNILRLLLNYFKKYQLNCRFNTIVSYISKISKTKYFKSGDEFSLKLRCNLNFDFCSW